MKNENDVVVPRQDEIRIYTSAEGDVVIAQNDDNHPDGEHCIYVNRVNLPPIIAKLQSYLTQVDRGDA